MSDTFCFTAEKRERAGKGAARAVRREGRIPAVIYGDKKDAVMITLEPREVTAQLHKPGFFAHTFEIDTAGAKETVICRDVQFHPVTDVPLHLDFLRLAEGASITVDIPVVFINEDQSEGLKRGGVLNVVRHTVECNVPAVAIPESFTIDLAGLEVGDSVHISAVTLPEGVAPTITDRDFTIATIAAPTVAKATEEAEGGEEEAAEE